MNPNIELWETPSDRDMYLVAGWHQWADAGAVSSGLPQYLIDLTNARRIGEIDSDPFYLFQVPGTHHLLRPEIKFEDGFPVELRPRRNDFYYADVGDKGLLIFLGEEPHLNMEEYAEAFLDAAAELGVKRTIVLGGVYGSMPYNKDRNVSTAYSRQALRPELDNYAVRYSNYEGGASIGSLFAEYARQRDVDLLTFYALVPAYDFSQASMLNQGIRIENDFKAWYDITRRIDYMFELGLDLSDLAEQGARVITSMDEKLKELAESLPNFDLQAYLDEIGRDFTEKPFAPLDDVWERELGDLFDDSDT